MLGDFCSSLAVRDLSNLVKPADVVTSEHLTTLLAVVSKYSQKDWLSSYETLTTYVVRSLLDTVYSFTYLLFTWIVSLLCIVILILAMDIGLVYSP